MKRLISGALVAAAAGTLMVFTLADAGPGGPGYGPGMMGPGGGPMVGRMAAMRGAGGGPGCAGFMANGAATPDATAPVTEDKARTLATEYASKYFAGYTVERVLPVQGRIHTMYQVELKGPKGEARVLHVNPWGGVRPFGGFAAAN